ncbi:MAG: sugar ABC transporter permease [Actinomycetia bacterium]|nr:sugar ABC transporter permease [Actinomycetes bacterium]
MLIPAVLSLVVVLGLPIIASLALSLKQPTTDGGLFSGPWVGFANFRAVFSDPLLRTALWNTAYFTVIEVVVVIVAAIAIAQLLSHRLARSAFFKVVLLVPWALSSVANATMWKWIYNANYGVLNTILKQTHVRNDNVIWLGSARMALNALLFADIWKSIPFITLLMIAGLQNIPSPLYRAARIDGANAWQRFRYVTLPQLRPTLLICVVLQTIWALKVFDLIYILTMGGPADGTVTLNFLAYRTTFAYGDIGRGSAIADVLFFIMLIFAFVYIRTFRPTAGASQK